VHDACVEPRDLQQIPTPVALLEQRRLDRNIVRMPAHVAVARRGESR
jgi:D-serine deaminase-like pyridoxal phosphate-dependent protein